MSEKTVDTGRVSYRDWGGITITLSKKAGQAAKSFLEDKEKVVASVDAKENTVTLKKLQ